MRYKSDMRPDFEVKHIGINAPDRDTALTCARLLGDIFHMTVNQKENSVFASNAIEFMNSPGRGSCGHIAIATSSVPEAAKYLEELGVRLDYATARTGPDGRMNFIYLTEPVCGFALHLVDRAPDVSL